ncbi:hypothetical protein BMH25_05630 [Leucobacter sp. OLCALW19]|nr:hypothetical protein BMH25_05630 [Leucobacter sp. OLCALW19]
MPSERGVVPVVQSALRTLVGAPVDLDHEPFAEEEVDPMTEHVHLLEDLDAKPSEAVTHDGLEPGVGERSAS